MSEGSTASVGVILSSNYHKPIEYTITVDPDSNIDSNDYGPIRVRRLGLGGTDGTAQIPIRSDSINERFEYLRLRLSATVVGTGETVPVKNGVTTVYVLDPSDYRAYSRNSLTLSTATLSLEGAAREGQSAMLRVTLSHSLPTDVTLPLLYRDRDQSAGSGDYTKVPSITVPAGQTQATVGIPLLDDGIDESREEFLVKLGPLLPLGIAYGNSGYVSVIITDAGSQIRQIHQDTQEEDDADADSVKAEDDDEAADNPDDTDNGSPENSGSDDEAADNPDDTDNGSPENSGSDDEAADNPDDTDNGSPENSGSDDEAASPDRGVLLAIYKEAGGSGWTVNNNWGTDEPVGTWHGVKTDSAGRVMELRLPSNNLAGKIADDIGDLAKLKVLYLNDNSLRGDIPAAKLSALRSLEELALWGNSGLAGPKIPRELGKRVDRAVLRTLRNVNGGSGGPEGWFPEDGDLFSYSGWSGIVTDEDGRVSELDLSGAGLGGDITDALSALSALKRLDLSGNAELKGELPRSLMRTQLEYLDISASGICPPEDEEFSQWLLGITFTGNDDICEGESEATDEADNVTGGGGCSIASHSSAWRLGGALEILLSAIILGSSGIISTARRRKKAFKP